MKYLLILIGSTFLLSNCAPSYECTDSQGQVVIWKIKARFDETLTPEQVNKICKITRGQGD